MAKASYDRRQRRLRKKNLMKAVAAGKIKLVPKAELLEKMEKAKDKVNMIAR